MGRRDWAKSEQGRVTHLQDTLLLALEGYDGPHWWVSLAARDTAPFSDQLRQRWWDRQPVKKRAIWLLERLSSCSDPLPDASCHRLGLPNGSSYADMVRLLKVEIEGGEVPAT